MTTKTTLIFKTLNILTWIIFLGLSIKTFTLIFTLLFSLFINPIASQDLHLGLDLSNLMEYDKWNYISMVVLIILTWGLKAFLFYWIIKIFVLASLKSPFTLEVNKLITRIGGIALSIGLVSEICIQYYKWLNNKGILLNNLWEYIHGGGEFLFTAAILFAMVLVFKRGIEFQSENELTI